MSDSHSLALFAGAANAILLIPGPSGSVFIGLGVSAALAKRT